jgi:hypothetical protein
VAGEKYGVYGRTGGSELFIGMSNPGAASFDDTGAVTPSGAVPTADSRIGFYDPHIPGVGNRGSSDTGIKVVKATAVKQTNVYFLR